LTSDKIWKATKKALIRALYDMIDAHEKHGQTCIDINWLRDYVDDIAIHYPETEPLLEK